jgi:hypothetical protein
MPKFCHNCGAALADRGAFCTACGTPVVPGAHPAPQSASAMHKPDADPSNHRAAVSAALQGDTWARVGLITFGAIVVFGIFWALLTRNGNPPTPSVVENATPPATTNVARTPAPIETIPQQASFIPPTQRSFTSIVESFIPSYNAADTEIRKTNVRFERKNAVARYVAESGGLRFQGWAGQVESLKTESDGEASVSVKLSGSQTVIRTWNNSFSDSDAHTMISRNDALYQFLTAIKEGDEVTVSGTFLLSDNQSDYIKESSLTEAGSMTTPEFLVRFSEIKVGLPVPTQNVPATSSPALEEPNNSTDETQPVSLPSAVTVASVEPSSILQLDPGVRLLIRVVSISRYPDGHFTFRGTLLQPAGKVAQGTGVVGSAVASSEQQMTVSVSELVIRGASYKLHSIRVAGTPLPGTGPGVELADHKTLEMWFSSASVYEKTTGIDAAADVKP